MPTKSKPNHLSTRWFRGTEENAWQIVRHFHPDDENISIKYRRVASAIEEMPMKMICGILESAMKWKAEYDENPNSYEYPFDIALIFEGKYNSMKREEGI